MLYSMCAILDGEAKLAACRLAPRRLLLGVLLALLLALPRFRQASLGTQIAGRRARVLSQMTIDVK